MKKLVLLLGMISGIVSLNASASFSCTVDISNVLIYQNGLVNVKHTGRNDFTYICNLTSDWNGVNPVTCAMWTSILQNLKQDNNKAVFKYNGEGSCETLPTYDASISPDFIGSSS